MSDDEREVLRQALAQTESNASEGRRSPSFTSVWAHIAANPSPMDAPRWSLSRSWGVAWQLVVAQLRIVPWLVIPVMLASSGLAAISARWFSTAQNAQAAASGFASVTLLGVIIVTTFAISAGRGDTVIASTPVGASAVLAARMSAVLGLNVLCALATSVIAVTTGLPVDLGALILGWFAPALVVSGLVTLVGVWVTPWAGAALGILGGSLLLPTNEAGTQVGLGVVTAAIHQAMPAGAMIAVGAVLLAGAIVSAHYTVRRRVVDST